VLDTIAMDIPFILLSTRVNCLGEIEKRVLTPFGTLDVTFRRIWDLNGREPYFEIKVTGDTEIWLFYNQAIDGFKKAVLDFVWKIAKKHFSEGVIGDFEKLSVHIKGSETNLCALCSVEREGEESTCRTA